MQTNVEKKMSILEDDIVELITAKYAGIKPDNHRKALLEAVRMGRQIEAKLNGR
jgi:hypothetical protein